MKRIHVVAAVIHGDCVGREQQILISKRPDHLHQGGKWEFPGGKVEAGEPVELALRRELQEELAIDAGDMQPLIQIQHDYPDKSVFLDVWDVLTFSGTPQGMEGQRVEWVPTRELDQYQFPDANVPILQAVKLPDRYWITPEADGALSEFLAMFEAKLRAGAELIQLRTKSLSGDKLVALCRALLPLKLRFDFRLLLNGDCYETLQVGQQWREVFSLFDGFHLTASQLQAEYARSRTDDDDSGQRGKTTGTSFASMRLLAASCHGADDIVRAEAMGCQMATLSPVRVTESHPDTDPLDMEAAAQWVRRAKIPLYALGGLEDADVGDMKACGFQGVAGIRKVCL